MKIIVTIIPTDLVTNLFLSFFFFIWRTKVKISSKTDSFYVCFRVISHHYCQGFVFVRDVIRCQFLNFCNIFWFFKTIWKLAKLLECKVYCTRCQVLFYLGWMKPVPKQFRQIARHTHHWYVPYAPTY